MEEKKVDFGSIQIHKKVLADIAETTIEGIDGVRLIPGDIGSRLIAFVSKDTHPSITVSIDKDNQVNLEVKILVGFGLNIPDVAKRVQDDIRVAIEQTTDIDLRDVHVNIQGIERGNQ